MLWNNENVRMLIGPKVQRIKFEMIRKFFIIRNFPLLGKMSTSNISAGRDILLSWSCESFQISHAYSIILNYLEKKSNIDNAWHFLPNKSVFSVTITISVAEVFLAIKFKFVERTHSSNDLIKLKFLYMETIFFYFSKVRQISRTEIEHYIA